MRCGGINSDNKSSPRRLAPCKARRPYRGLKQRRLSRVGDRQALAAATPDLSAVGPLVERTPTEEKSPGVGIRGFLHSTCKGWGALSMEAVLLVRKTLNGFYCSIERVPRGANHSGPVANGTRSPPPPSQGRC